MENKKYELVKDDSIVVDSRILYRIRSLKDFGNVKVGDMGGYISGEHNLSHDGDCWIYNNTKVFDNARVYGYAKIFDSAIVYGNAMVYGDVEVFGNVKVYGNAEVFGNARIYDNAYVCGDAKVRGNAFIFGDARVYGNAMVYDSAIVSGDARIFGDTNLVGYSVISDNAHISSDKDYLYIKGLGSDNGSATAFKLFDGDIYVNCGCFNDTLDKFETDAKEDRIDNKYGREYMMLIDMCKLHFGL